MNVPASSRDPTGKDSSCVAYAQIPSVGVAAVTQHDLEPIELLTANDCSVRSAAVDSPRRVRGPATPHLERRSIERDVSDAVHRRERRRPARFRRGGHRTGCIRHPEEPAADATGHPAAVRRGPDDRMETIRQRGGVDGAEPDRTIAVGKAREQRRDVGSEVVVGRASDRDTVDEDGDRRAVLRDELRLLRQRPPEVHVRRASSRVTLARRVDRAERRCRVRVVARQCPGPQQQNVTIAIGRIRMKHEDTVALRRQHVGQDHEAPSRAAAPRIQRERRLHVGPCPVDEDPGADDDLCRPAAIRIDRSRFSSDGCAADEDIRHFNVVEYPTREGHGARHSGRVVERRVDDTQRVGRGPGWDEGDRHGDRRHRVPRTGERHSNATCRRGRRRHAARIDGDR